MRCRVTYRFAALVLILVLSAIIEVKGQSTLHVCENGDLLSSIEAEQILEAIRQMNIQLQSIREILTESKQERKSQQNTDLTVIGIDLGGVPVLLPIVNNWIVFMNRFDGSLDFNRTWREYRNGFGDIGRGEFWLGNEIVHRLTNRVGVTYILRVEVQLNATGDWFYAEYATFSIDSEGNNNTLRLSGFSGNAGDSLTNTSVRSTHWHNGRSFSTRDADNDRDSRHCARNYSGGWWYDACFVSCLTCTYRSYFAWHIDGGWQTSGLLRASRMMIKSI